MRRPERSVGHLESICRSLGAFRRKSSKLFEGRLALFGVSWDLLVVATGLGTCGQILSYETSKYCHIKAPTRLLWPRSNYCRETFQKGQR